MTTAVAVHCISIDEPDRRPADLPGNSARVRPAKLNNADSENRSWKDVFARRGDITGFQPLHTGQVKVPREGMLNTERPEYAELSPEDRSAEVFVDVYAFWFCHKREGCFLIDTGLDTSFQKGEQGGGVRGMLADGYILTSRQEPGQDILSQLERVTSDDNQLKGVFFTHLHGDHSSGVPAISAQPEYQDVRWFVGKDETYVNYFMLYYSQHLAGIDVLEELDLAAAPMMPPLGRAVDVFGDGSFWAVSTPGHSNAHLSYVIMAPRGPILLTGDASHTRLGFEHNIEPGWVNDRGETRRSFEQLKAFAEEFPEVEVIFGHER